MSNFVIQNRAGVRVFLVGTLAEAELFTMQAAARWGAPATLAGSDGTPLLTAEVDEEGEPVQLIRR